MENNIKPKKYIECKDCKYHYDCERTYLSGCFDGKEWEVDYKEFFDEFSTSCEELKTATNNLKKAMSNVVNAYKPEMRWRNLRMDFWREICKK